MSIKFPIPYSIETQPLLCHHRKIPQHIQTIYCQEKPIRLEEKTYLKKIGETSAHLSENLWKSDLRQENIYRNKRDFEASIFALEFRKDCKTLEKSPQKSLKLMDKFRQSCRNSKKFWIKTKVAKEEESLTWIMKPLRKIKMSDMELAKKLKEKDLKEELYKRFKTKCIKGYQAKGIKREQVKAFLEKGKESATLLFKTNSHKDTKGSFVNKIESSENKHNLQNFADVNVSQDNEETKEPEKQNLCVPTNSKEKYKLIKVKARMTKSSLVKSQNKSKYKLNEIKSLQESKNSLNKTKIKETPQSHLKSAENIKSSSGSESFVAHKSSEKSKSSIFYNKIKGRNKRTLKQEENIKSSFSRNKSFQVNSCNKKYKDINSTKLKSNEKDKRCQSKNQSSEENDSSFLQTKAQINLKSYKRVKTFQNKNQIPLETKSSKEFKASLVNRKTTTRNQKNFKSDDNLKISRSQEVERSKSSLPSTKYKEQIKRNLKSDEESKISKLKNQSLQDPKSSRESKSSKKSISNKKSTEIIERNLKNDEKSKSLQHIESFGASKISLLIPKTKEINQENLRRSKSSQLSESSLLSMKIKAKNKWNFKSVVNTKRSLQQFKSLQGSKNFLSERKTKVGTKISAKSEENTYLQNTSLEETKSSQDIKKFALELKNKVSTNLTLKGKQKYESFSQKTKSSPLQKKNDQQLGTFISKNEQQEKKVLNERNSSEKSQNQIENHLELKSFSEAKLHLSQHLQKNMNKLDQTTKNALSNEKFNEKSDLKCKSSHTKLKAMEKSWNGNRSLKLITTKNSFSKILSRKESFNETKSFAKETGPETKPRTRKKSLNHENTLPQTNSVLIHYIRNIIKTKAFKSSQNKKQKILENKVDLKNSKEFETIYQNSDNKTKESFVAKTQAKEKIKEKNLKKSLAKVNRRKSLTKSNSSLYGKPSLVKPILQKYPRYMIPKQYPEDIYKNLNKTPERNLQYKSKSFRKNPKFNLTNDFIQQYSKAFNDSDKIIKLYTAKDLTNETMTSRRVCTSSCYSKTLEILSNLGKPKPKPKVLFNKLPFEFAKDPLKVLENVGIQVLKTKSKKANLTQSKKNL